MEMDGLVFMHYLLRATIDQTAWLFEVKIKSDIDRDFPESLTDAPGVFRI